MSALLPRWGNGGTEKGWDPPCITQRCNGRARVRCPPPEGLAAWFRVTLGTVRAFSCVESCWRRCCEAAQWGPPLPLIAFGFEAEGLAGSVLPVVRRICGPASLLVRPSPLLRDKSGVTLLSSCSPFLREQLPLLLLDSGEGLGETQPSSLPL